MNIWEIELIFQTLFLHLNCIVREPFRERVTKVSWMTKGKYLKYVFLLRFVEGEVAAKKQPEDIREFRAQNQANWFCPVEGGGWDWIYSLESSSGLEVWKLVRLGILAVTARRKVRLRGQTRLGLGVIWVWGRIRGKR